MTTRAVFELTMPHFNSDLAMQHSRRVDLDLTKLDAGLWRLLWDFISWILKPKACSLYDSKRRWPGVNVCAMLYDVHPPDQITKSNRVGKEVRYKECRLWTRSESLCRLVQPNVSRQNELQMSSSEELQEKWSTRLKDQFDRDIRSQVRASARKVATMSSIDSVDIKWRSVDKE